MDACQGARVEGGQGQSGYLYMYPNLLLLTGAGATGLAGVLCPGGNTPLLQQGETDTHKHSIKNARVGIQREKRWREGREEKEELSSAARHNIRSLSTQVSKSTA